MARLCERPGCSEPGAVAYGFDAARLLVWLAALDPDGDRHRLGTLCVRHADAMVVPLGWTLEDARDPMPRLFRPASGAPARRPARKPASKPAGKPAGKRDSRRTKSVPKEQLALVEPDDQPPAPSASTAPSVPNAAADHTVASVTGAPTTTDDPDATVAMPWLPEFDVTDDLGGALSADTPLLARAFRGIDRNHA